MTSLVGKRVRVKDCDELPDEAKRFANVLGEVAGEFGDGWLLVKMLAWFREDELEVLDAGNSSS